MENVLKALVNGKPLNLSLIGLAFYLGLLLGVIFGGTMATLGALVGLWLSH